jgi:radical SAM superfamily enzyme YgiQ (UPF0313 family)
MPLLLRLLPHSAVNQHSWRQRSPESLVREIRTIHEQFGIKQFFGADDNFFNHRQTAESILTAMASAPVRGGRLADKIRFSTEATQVDTYKHRDLLPLAKRAGMRMLWFGIEDLTATLVNKGQKAAITTDLFRILRDLKIAPMAMLMFTQDSRFTRAHRFTGCPTRLRFCGAPAP